MPMNKQRLPLLKGFINKHTRFLLAFSFLFFCTTHSFSSVIIDAQCTSGSLTGEWLGTANGRQQFTPSISGTIYKVRVHTATYGSAATITLRLFSGPTPGSGSLLTSVVYGKPAGTNSWDDVVLPGPGIVVSSGSPYYLEIAVGSQIDWIASPINVYAPGMAWRDGTSYPNMDYKFEIHMAVPTCGTVTAGANQSGVIANTPSSPLALNGGGDPGAWTTSGAGTFSDVHNPNATYTPACSETGTLTTLTWTSSCNMSSTIQTINVAPHSLTVNNATICAGAIATLTASGASSFSWNPGGATTSSINVSPGTTTTYTVTGVQGNGCTTSKIATVNVNPLPVMTSINSATICSGGSVTIPLTANQPSSFVWLAGDNTSTTGESTSNQTSSLLSNNITNISTVPQQVLYGVVPTNTTTSCQGPSQTVTVTVNPTPTITSSFGTTVCSGSSVGFNFISSVSPATFSWYTTDNGNTTGESTSAQNNSILTDNITNLTASVQQLTYTVTPTATASGCGGSSQSCTVNVSPRPVPNAGPDISVCNGSTQNITASASSGSPGYSYNWYDAATGGTLLATTQVYTPPVLSPGMYNFFVQVTDAVPCASTGRDPMLFIVNLNPVLSLSTTNVSCNGAANGSISSTPSGGTAPYQFSLNGGSYVSTSTFTGLNPGTYTVTTIDNNSCVSSQYNTSVTEPALLSSTITTSTNVSCNGGSNGSATVSVSGGMPSYIYSWAPSGGTGTTASGLTANTYTCTITDANSCTKTQTVTINQPTPLILTTLSSTNVSCNGGSNGAASVNTATGGTPGYTYDWTPGTPTGDGTTSVTGLNANSYSCTVTDANSCTALQVFNITEPSPLNGSSSVTNVSCNGGSNGSINTTPSGGTGPYQYSLNGGGFVGAPSFSGLVAGNYTVTIRDNNNCTVNITSSITEPTALSSSVNATGASCFGGTDGTITGTGFGGIPPYQYSLNGGAYTVSSAFTGLSAGVYTVVVMDNNGCTTAGNTNTVFEPSQVVASIGTIINVDCFGNNTGSVNVSPSGGVGGYQYSVNGGPYMGPGAYTGLVAGSYTTTIMDGNGCVSSPQFFTITEPPSLNLVLSSTDVSCNGGNDGTVTGMPSGGTTPYSLSIDGGTTFFPASPFTNLTAGTYTVIARDANNCITAGFTVAVNQPAALSFSGTPVDVDCFSNSTGSINVSASGGAVPYFYSLNGGAYSASSSFTGLPAGSYTITARDNNNCTTGPTVFTINEPAGLGVSNSSTDVSCNGGSNGSITVTTFGGTPSFLYAINGGSFVASPTFTGLSAGSYTLTVQDANGCPGGIIQTISEPSALVASVGSITNVACNGASTGSVNIITSGGSPDYDYSINSGPYGNGPTFTALSAGSYTVDVRDVMGCNASPVLFNITEPAPLLVNNTGSSIVCGDVPLNISLSASGGATPYSFQWVAADNTNTSNESLTPVTTNLVNDIITNVSGTAQLVDYTFTVTDNNSCSNFQNVSVTVNPTPAPSPTNGGDVCLGTAATFNTSTFSSYAWDFGDGGTSSTQNPSYTYSAPGTYTTTLVVTSSAGCTNAAASVITTVYPTPVIPTAGSDAPVCEGADINFTANSSVGSSYTWSGPNSFVSTSQNPVINLSSLAANGTYTVTATIGTCTSTPSTVIVVVNALPSMPVTGNSSPICENDPLSLNSTPSGGTAPYSYSWAGPAGFSASTQNPSVSSFATISNSGTYSLTVTDANSCVSAMGTTNVTVNPQPNFTINAPSSICSNYHLNLGINGLTGGSSFIYNWSGPGAFASTLANPIRNNITSGDAGSYSVDIQNEFGCSFSDAVSIGVSPSPTADATGGPAVVCANENASLTASSSIGNGGTISGYQWLIGNTPIVGANLINLSANTPGNYFVEVTNTNGCVDTSIVFVLANKAIPVPVITGNASFCSGTSSLLDGSTSTGGGAASVTSYQWMYNGAVIASAISPSYTANAGGNYELIVGNNNGCTDTSVVFFLNEQLPPSAPVISSAGNSLCLNDSLLMSVPGPTAGHSYAWAVNPPNMGIVDPSAIATDVVGQFTGTYTVSVTETDASGCVSNPGTSIITVNSLPVANALPPSASNICYNGTVSLSMSTVAGATAYNWLSSLGLGSNLQSTFYSNITAPGTVLFFATVTDANGCTSLPDTVSVVVGNPIAAPTINGVASVCEGQGFSLSATPVVAGANYTWTDPSSGTQSGVNLSGITIPVSSAANAGPYTVSYTDANGCASLTSTAFTQALLPLPVVSVNGSTALCSGNSTTLNASTSIGTASAYQWYSNGNIISGANTASYNVTNAGSYNVVVTLTTGCSDSASSSTNVVISAPPTVSINTGTTSVCEGSLVTLTASGTATSYLWSTGSTSLNISFPAVSSNSYTVTGTDANGCTNSDIVAITVNARPAAPTTSVSSSAVCAGIAVTFNSGSSLTNNWYNVANGSTVSNLQSFVHTETVAGTYNYGVYVTDANACNSDTSFTSVVFNNCLTSLNAEMLSTSANTPVSGNIFTNDGSPPGYTANPSPVAGPLNGSFTINSSGAFNYTPNTGFSGNDMIVVTGCDPGSNCSNDTIFIRINPYAGKDQGTVSGLIANSQLTGNVTINDAGSGIAGSVVLLNTTSNGVLVISAAGDFTYTPTPNYCGIDSFLYQITDVNGYTASAYCIIDVSCTVEIVTPSGFSPNGDGVNDVWVISGLDMSLNKVSIYDRWGNEIWAENNYNNTSVAWNGKNKNGEELTVGTYFYMIEVDGKDPVRGWVEITK